MTTPRNLPISSRGDVGAELSGGLALLDPLAASLACLRGGDGDPALAQPRVRLQAPAELEVDREPVGLVLGDGGEQRVEASLGEQRVEPFVVLGREREEELLLGREPVEDRSAREPDLPFQADDGRALVAVTCEAPTRAVEHTSPTCVLLGLAQLRHVCTLQNSTYVLYSRNG